MDKNLIVAVLLSTLFLGIWYKFFTPAPTPAPAIQASVQAQSVAKPAASEPSAVLAVNSSVVEEREAQGTETKIIVNSRGAAIKNWWVKDSRENSRGDDAKAPLVDLVNHAHQPAVDILQWATYPELNFSPLPSADPRQSAWRALLPGGVELVKTYSVEGQYPGKDPSAHFVRLRMSFKNRAKSEQSVSNLDLAWAGGLGTVKSEEKENAGVTRVLAYPSADKDVVKFKTGEYKNDFSWIAIDNRYYLLAILPQSGASGQVEVEKSKQEPGKLTLALPEFKLAPGETRDFEFEIYGGPKGYTNLKKLGLSLEHAVDFGYFGFLGKWALKALNFLYHTTGNYGWAIISLTVFLQILVFPLTLKSFQSTAAMKKLQPKIQEIQKRYKSDAARMNQEMMSLYRESKTNPFGGCLPMLLQIPVFWAFFTMLRNAYELRGAPWIFWIKDLSQHDPYYVLPIVMGGGMFLQQKVSGSAVSMDPNQAKIMMFMPVIFTFMFFKFPSGLVLYWLTNSILTLSAQYWLMKRSEVRAA